MAPKLTFPLLALIGATRGIAGIGLGLLLADRIAQKRRHKIGIALFAAGAASTIPILATVIRRSRRRGVVNATMPQSEIYEPMTAVIAEDADLVQQDSGFWP